MNDRKTDLQDGYQDNGLNINSLVGDEKCKKKM